MKETYEQMMKRAKAEQDQRRKELLNNSYMLKQIKRLNDTQNIYDKMNPHKQKES